MQPFRLVIWPAGPLLGHPLDDANSSMVAEDGGGERRAKDVSRLGMFAGQVSDVVEGGSECFVGGLLHPVHAMAVGQGGVDGGRQQLLQDVLSRGR